jgi:hypothetical protein
MLAANNMVAKVSAISVIGLIVVIVVWWGRASCFLRFIGFSLAEPNFLDPFRVDNSCEPQQLRATRAIK